MSEENDGARKVCCYKEAMLLTGLKKTKLYALFRRGVIRGYRDGKMIRFYVASLTKYMRDRENSPPPVGKKPRIIPRVFTPKFL
ncbi:helix-turn-helix domain-containing protein [Zavarzinella formosa]|uniref:helix-turn-helix domain-containing protein n=1 Tax=Zavarzinella formosa TaxID=360055 RepID=UPI000496E3FC|nr:helix-turn-helix domain-containing protein [Zavarzinella formosa]